MRALQPEPEDPPLPRRPPRGSAPAGSEGRPRGWTSSSPGTQPGSWPGAGAGAGDGPKPRVCAPLPVGFPAAARPAPSLPVVAVIFERREVLLQLAVRLLQPLAQVLELAAERGLEGVLGVHARAAPPPGQPSPSCPPPAAPPFVSPPSPPLLLPAPGIRGGQRAGRDRGGGAGDGGGGEGARRKAGAGALGRRLDDAGGRREERGWMGSGPRRPREGPEERKVPRPSAASLPRETEKELGGGNPTPHGYRRPRQKYKGHSHHCSYRETGNWAREERKRGLGNGPRARNAGRVNG